MNEQEVLCASLDNTSIRKEEENVGNSNPTFGVPEQFSMKKGDEPDGSILPSGNEGQSNPEQGVYDEKVMKDKTISSDQELQKNPDSESSKNAASLDENKIDASNPIRPGNSNSLDKTDYEEREEEDNQDDSEQDYDEDVMTGSYGEISLDPELLNCDKNSDSLEDDRCFLDDKDPEVKEKKRPDSLILAAKPEECSGGSHRVHQSQQTSGGRGASVDPSPLSSEEFALHSAGRVRSGSDTSGLSELQGTLTVEGDIVTFVAEDLAEKIKMSSPVNRWADSSLGGSRSSTPSLYKQALQPNHHIIDPTILSDLEAHAKKVATCVDTMLENLSGTLQSISSLTVDCMETYESSVCKTCDAVDSNIKAVYQLMAKCEELNNSMGPLYCLSSDVKYIKMILDQLEHVVEHKS